MIKYILNREKKFDKYIIAYIDFLGIKQKMNTNGSYESLQILKFLLWGIQRTASYISSINEIDEFDIKNMATATTFVEGKDKVAINYKAVEMEVVPSSIDRIEVYEGRTIEELAALLDRSLKGALAGKGMLIGSYCLETGVDPVVATAIMLHETGCNSKCSVLTTQCNNVGGQKGYPRCGNGSFKRYDTLDDGIKGVINNLSWNYYGIGLNTIDAIAPKYAEGNTWAGKIHYYVNKIRTS